MTKENEINYLKNIGQKGKWHASKKPFSDENCGAYLAEIGAIMALMPNPPAKVLDLGCGTGWTSKFLSQRGYRVVGSDISPGMIKEAIKNNVQSDNLKFIVEDYENLNFNEEFDCVIFFDALHHAENEQKAIECAYKSLKNKGICITSEPDKGHKKRESARYAVKKYGVTEKSMAPKYIIKLGKKAGFKKFRIYPKADLINFILYKRENALPVSSFFKKMFRIYIVKIMAIVLLTTFYKIDNGIVVMEK